MTVYVDDMRASYGRMKMCHMLADSDEELRAMADRIGVAQQWHQGDHFDIALSKRTLAIQAGAVEITIKQAAKMNYIRRRTGKLGNPGTCDQVFTELWRTPRALVPSESL